MICRCVGLSWTGPCGGAEGEEVSPLPGCSSGAALTPRSMDWRVNAKAMRRAKARIMRQVQSVLRFRIARLPSGQLLSHGPLQFRPGPLKIRRCCQVLEVDLFNSSHAVDKRQEVEGAGLV